MAPLLTYAQIKATQAAQDTTTHPGGAILLPTAGTLERIMPHGLPRITVIMNLCANDLDFLPFSLSQLRMISNDIILVVGNLLHDGKTPEDVDAIIAFLKQSGIDNVTLVQYHSGGIGRSVASGGYGAPYRRFWNKYARWSGAHYTRQRDGSAQDPNHWFLIADADEIIDGFRMLDWALGSSTFQDYDVIELSAYEYGEGTSEQVLQWSHAGVFIRADEYKIGYALHSDDRYFYKDLFVAPSNWRIKLVAVHHVDFEPMLHHYSMSRASHNHWKRKVMTSAHFADSMPENAHLKIRGPMFDPSVEKEMVAMTLEDALANETLRFALPSRPSRLVKPFFQFSAPSSSPP